MASETQEGYNPWHDLPPEEEYALLKNSMKLFAPDGTPIDIEATVIDPEWAEWMKDNQEPVESGKDDDALEAILAWQARELTANNCGTGGGGFKPGNSCAKGGGSGKIKDKHGVSYDVLYDDSTRTYSISRPGKEDLLEHGVRSGFATLKKNFSGVMSVEVQPEFRRRGLATALYTHIEQHLGRPLKENWATTPDGEAFWKSRNNPTANKSEIPTFSSPREELEYWTRIEESLGEE